jgi:hypothetical protein
MEVTKKCVNIRFTSFYLIQLLFTVLFSVISLHGGLFCTLMSNENNVWPVEFEVLLSSQYPMTSNHNTNASGARVINTGLVLSVG